MKTLFVCIGLCVGLVAGGFAAPEVDGVYKVTESWTVTIDYQGFNMGEEDGYGVWDTRTFYGQETGFIRVMDGEYEVINHTGFALTFLGDPIDLTGRSISLNGNRYDIIGDYPFVPAYSRKAYGLAFLACFAVKVPLIDGEVPAFHRTSNFEASGVASSIEGSGIMDASDLEARVSSTLKLELQPYFSMAGNYAGLFYEDAGVVQASSGAFNLTVTDSGRYSGKLLTGASALSVSGGLDPEGMATNVIQRKNDSPLVVRWGINMRGRQTVTGIVESATWRAALSGDGSSKYFPAEPTSLTGSYTFAIPSSAAESTEPEGNGFGTVTVDRKGVGTFKGTLADGTKFTKKSQISESGMFPLHALLYGNRGSLVSWVSFDTTRINDDLQGTLKWIRPAGKSPASYTNGFTMETEMTGSFYRKPVVPGARILDVTNGVVELSGGPMPAALANSFVLGANSKWTNTGPDAIKISFTTSSGLFKGTVTPSGTRNSVNVAGAVLQKSRTATGFFIQSNLSGRVTMIMSP